MKTKKTKGKKSKGTAMVKAQPQPIMIAGKEASKAFIAKAEKVDTQIRDQVLALGKGHTNLTKLLISVKDNSYHLALGYKNFGEYVNNVMNMSASKAFAHIAVYRELTTGDRPIKEADLNDMSMQNAEALVKLKRDKPSAITPRVIEAAKNLPERRFQEEIVVPATRSKHGDAPEPQVMIRMGPFHLTKEIAEQFNRCLEIARWVARDDDREITVTEKAIEAMSAEFIATYEAEYEDFKKQEELDAEKRATDAGQLADQEEYAEGQEGGPRVGDSEVESGTDRKPPNEASGF